MSLYTFVNDSI